MDDDFSRGNVTRQPVGETPEVEKLIEAETRLAWTTAAGYESRSDAPARAT